MIIVFTVGLILIIGLIVLISITYTPKIKNEKNEEIKDSIAEFKKIQLGGVEQTILVRGANKNNPILLFLHGGPGSPDMPMVRFYNSKLEDDFVVVTWDQRGCGKSYNKNLPIDSLKMQQFISDTKELISFVLKEFGQPKLNLICHSWGTILGINIIKSFPDVINSYIGIGQVVNMHESEKFSYEFVKEEAANGNQVKTLKEIETLGMPVDGHYKGGVADMINQRNVLLKLGGVLHKQSSYKPMVIAYNKAKETGLKDLLIIKKASEISLNALWNEVVDTNFLNGENEFKVPMYFISGEHDKITSPHLVKSFYEKITAPEKQFYLFEESAHFPQIEESVKFMGIVQKHCK